MLLLLAQHFGLTRGANAGALLHRSGRWPRHIDLITLAYTFYDESSRVQLTTLGTRDSRQESSWPTHTLPTASHYYIPHEQLANSAIGRWTPAL